MWYYIPFWGTEEFRLAGKGNSFYNEINKSNEAFQLQK